MWVTRIGPDLIPRREQLRQQVFRPGHNLPTMTLEQLAQQEMQEAQQREERSAAAQATRVMSLKEVEETGKEDDDGAYDDATLKARNWDDWKGRLATWSCVTLFGRGVGWRGHAVDAET